MIIQIANIGFSIRIALAAGISYCLPYLLHDCSLSISQELGGLWSAISAVLVLKLNSKDTLYAGFHRTLGTFIGSLVSALYLLLINNVWFFPVAVFVCSIICLSIKFLNDSFAPSILAVCVILIVWQVSPQNHPILFSAARFINSLLGVLVSIAVFFVHLFICKYLKIKMK